MCSSRGRFASFSRLERAKRLVMKLSDSVLRSASAHSTAFSVICDKKSLPAIAGRGFHAGGGAGIRTLVTGVTGETVFETAAFDHSATPPQGWGRTGSGLGHARRETAPFWKRDRRGVFSRGRPGCQIWRRDRDSNPRYAFGAHTISNRAPSASSVISPLAWP